MVTTRGAVALEREVIALWVQGKDQAKHLVEGLAAPQVQQVAREMGLRRLSPRQEAAASLILEAKDRVIGVQGVAGAGKSTMLQPVTKIVGEQGRPVVALAVGAEIARKLGEDLGVPCSSVAAFLGRHRALLNADAPVALQDRSLAELKDAVIIVDEASTLSSRQAADLMRLAHRADVARLALVGDTRQYGAVEAGKPFADLQAQGLATAELTDNVRARSGIMKPSRRSSIRASCTRRWACSIPIRMRCHRAIWRPMRSPSGPTCRVRSASRPCFSPQVGPCAPRPTRRRKAF
jgi:hypothetical protein